MTVLVGLVPSPEGRAALEAAIEEARLRDSRLLVVNSARSGAHVDQSLVSQDELRDLEERLAGEGLRHEVVQDREVRDVVDHLLDVVEREDVRLLVIGLRRRSAVGKLLMGSTAQRLLLEAPCRILAVKP